MQTIAIDARLGKILITKGLVTTQAQSVRHVGLYTLAYSDLVDTIASMDRLIYLLVEARFRDYLFVPHERITTALNTTLRLQLNHSRVLVHYRRTNQGVIHVRWSRGHDRVIPYGIIDNNNVINENGISLTEFVLHRSIVLDTRVCIDRCSRYQQRTAQHSIEIMFHILEKSQITNR